MPRPIVLLFSRSRRDGIMARRARELARRSAAQLEVKVVFREEDVPKTRPDLVYVFDTVSRELLAAMRYRLRGVPLVVETGDVVSELRLALGCGRLRGSWLKALEQATWRKADALVLRGEGFREVVAERGVARRVDVLTDGVDLHAFRPLPPGPGRRRLGLEPEQVAVGVVGSIVWSPAHEIAYGWELVEALPKLPENVRVIIAGAGDGVARLQARAGELGVADRLLTPGNVPYDEVPELLAALDAAVWAQTPDAAGRGRTTMKLPEYLACGKFVIATDVGEARRAVNGNGVRIPYRGGRDLEYVDGVTRALLQVAADPKEAREHGRTGVARARRYEWDRIAAGFVGIVERTLAERR